jgi:hypothetical protein
MDTHAKPTSAELHAAHAGLLLGSGLQQSLSVGEFYRRPVPASRQTGG